MDRYEQAMRAYFNEKAPVIPMTSAERVVDAFRWYDEQRGKDHEDDLTCAYLAGVEAGKDKRAGEVCETPSHIMYNKSWWKYCPVCGRRIVEVK